MPGTLTANCRTNSYADRHDKILFMEIMLNGQVHQLPSLPTTPWTVAALIESLGYAGKRIAVERNGDLVPRSRHAEVILADGDRLEIVVAVGGG